MGRRAGYITLALVAAALAVVLRHFFGICLKYCGGPAWDQTPAGWIVAAFGLVVVVVIVLGLTGIIGRRSQR